ncbi:MAG: hypothetical protein M3167_04490 [Acidobacteriota bacterium]|nr:hypothetical protein [Acidobacteriota bacterium]
MRKAFWMLVGVSASAGISCSDRLPTAPGYAGRASVDSAAAATVQAGRSRRTIVIPPRGVEAARLGTWGSESASLTIDASAASLKLFALSLATGGCFGAFGDIPSQIPKGRFELPGTYTQLMGAYPGRTEFPARYEGFAWDDLMTLTVTVPSLPHVFGPYLLVYGAGNAWTPCLFP